MDRFVGAHRTRLVADLLERYDVCAGRGQAHLVCLEAEAGWGKTRIVQEFYQVLRRRRDLGNGYWPASLMEADSGVMQGRKSIYPVNPRIADGAAMPWLWWGLRCDRDSRDRRIRALEQARPQVQSHLADLVRRSNRRRGDVELLAEIAGEVIQLVPGVGTVIGVAGAGATVGPKIAARIRESMRRAPAEGPLATEVDESSQLELELVRRFVSPDLPLVLVVDDAHDADPATVRFIRDLLSMDRPILVVATAWPSALARQATTPVLSLQDLEFGDLLEELATADPARFTRVRLDPLTPAELAEVVLDEAPATQADRVVALTSNCDGNPLVLRLQIDSRRVRNSITDAAITLSPEQLAELPDAYEDLLADRYRSLEEREQLWLAEASWNGMDFVPQFMSQPVDQLDSLALAAFVRVSDRTSGPQVWQFIERPVWAAVHARANRLTTEDDERRWVQAILELGGGWLLDELQYDVEVGLLPHVRTLCHAIEQGREAGAVIDARLAVTAYLNLSWIHRDRGDHRAELAAAERALAWGEGPQEADSRADVNSRVAAAVRVGSALRAMNRGGEAVLATRAAVELARSEQGVLADRLFDALHGYASALVQTADPDSAGAIDELMEAAASSTDNRVAALRLRAQAAEFSQDVPPAVETYRAIIVLLEADPATSPLSMFLAELDVMEADPDTSAADCVDQWSQGVEAFGLDHWATHRALLQWGVTAMLNGDVPSWREVATEVARVQERGAAAPELEIVFATITQGLRAIDSGDNADLLRTLEDLFAEDSPYSSRRDLQITHEQRAIVQVMQPGFRDTDTTRQSALHALAVQVATSKDHRKTQDLVDAAFADLDSDDLVNSGLFVNLAISFVVEALIDGFTVDGDLLRKIASVPASGFVHDFQEVATRLLAEELPPPPAPTSPANQKAAVHAARAVLLHRRDLPGVDDELAAMRQLAGPQAPQSIHGITVSAHRACRSEATVSVLDAAIDSATATPSQQRALKTTLSIALFDQGEFARSAAVDEELLALARSDPETPPSRLATCLINLAITLERIGEEHLERERELRREAAALEVPTSGAVEANKLRLARIDGDRPAEMAAQLRYGLALGPSGLATINSVAVSLTKDSQWDLAKRVAVVAIGAFDPPDPPPSELRDVVVNNLRLLAARLGDPTLPADIEAALRRQAAEAATEPEPTDEAAQ